MDKINWECKFDLQRNEVIFKALTKARDAQEEKIKAMVQADPRQLWNIAAFELNEKLGIAREALKKITRQAPIIGSTGDYREGQLHALQACTEHANEALKKMGVE